MTSKADPLDWFIEVCHVCGCQLGPGIGSRTATGRCVDPSHHQGGGIIVRVIGRHPFEQDDITRRFYRNHPEIPTATNVPTQDGGFEEAYRQDAEDAMKRDRE
jgi:hypothetical protein